MQDQTQQKVISDKGLLGLQIVNHISLGISKSHSLTCLKLKFDFQYIKGESEVGGIGVYSL